MKEQDIDRIASMIYEAPLGKYIGRDGAAILAARAANERGLDDGEFLFRHGETTGSFYIVTSGRLARVIEATHECEESIVHVLEKGDLVGELSFIDQTPHALSVRALGHATVLCFSAEAVRPLITEQPELVFNFMRAVIKRIHHVATVVGQQERELQQYIATGGKGRM